MGNTTITVKPAEAVAALNGATLAGQDMEAAATRAETAGGALTGALAEAPVAAAAFDSFWSRYADLPYRAAATVLHQAACVGQATAEVVSMDQSMAASVTSQGPAGSVDSLLTAGGR